MKNQTERRSHGFTLVELLVSIVIVTVLASIAFAVGGRVKESGKAAATMGNLRQIGAASGAWMTDNGNFFLPCWDNTEGRNRSYAQVLDPYLHDSEAFRDPNSLFIGPNKRLPVKINEFSHPITFSTNRAVCRDITSPSSRVQVKLVHATQVKRPADVILMADGCQNPGNLNQANASAYRIWSATGESGPRGEFDEKIPVGPDEDTGSGDGWFRYPNGKCQALMCDGSVRAFSKGTITKRNLWIDVVR